MKSVSRLFSLVLTLLVACAIGRDGERCNPYLTHDECGPGLACTQPVDCPESYCCPASDPSSSTSAYCQRGCNGGQASMCAAGADADCVGRSPQGAAANTDADGGSAE
jgi:hypothetical protein